VTCLPKKGGGKMKKKIFEEELQIISETGEVIKVKN